MMALSTSTQYLKVRLPGGEPDAIPALKADELAKVPPRLLTILHDIGDVCDMKDVKIITVKDDRYNFILTKSAEFYTQGQIQHGEITVERVSSYRKVLYRRDVHEHDTKFSATPETHELFRKQVSLYTFCVRTGMKDFQAHLCETICSLYPVYEAEVVVLLIELCKSRDIYENADPALLGYLCQRITLLGDALTFSRPVLLLLREKIDPKDRFLSIVRHLDEASIERALKACHINETTEARALLGTFVEKHNHNVSSAQNLRQALEDRARGQNMQTRRTTPQTWRPSRSPSSSESITVTESAVTPTGRRYLQDGSPYRTRAPRTPYSGRTLRLKRPTTEGEYWSITNETWSGMTHISKRFATHAGLICETEAGMIAPEPCSSCAEENVVCEVYTPEFNERNVRAGATCARCRLHKGGGKLCSLSMAKRARDVQDE